MAVGGGQPQEEGLDDIFDPSVACGSQATTNQIQPTDVVSSSASQVTRVRDFWEKKSQVVPEGSSSTALQWGLPV